MRVFPPFCLMLAAALCMSCTDKADFDIEEVAPAEHLEEVHEHDHEEAADDHEEGCTCEACLDAGSGECFEHDHAAGEETETGMHIHPAGSRNHGTQWFFNQPWAAPFVWGKMIRDTLILVALSVAVALLSARRRAR